MNLCCFQGVQGSGKIQPGYIEEYLFFHLSDILKRAKLSFSDRRQTGGCLGVVVGIRTSAKKHKEYFGGDRNV